MTCVQFGNFRILGFLLGVLIWWLRGKGEDFGLGVLKVNIPYLVMDQHTAQPTVQDLTSASGLGLWVRGSGAEDRSKTSDFTSVL